MLNHTRDRTRGFTLVEALVAAALLGTLMTAFSVIARGGGDTARTGSAATNINADLQRTTQGIQEGDPRFLQSPVPQAILPAPGVVTVRLIRAVPPTYALDASSDGLTLSTTTTAPGGPK